MLPTREELERIAEVQQQNPDVPLDSAEHFLRTISTISCVRDRLHLWLFRVDFEAVENEVAEPMHALATGLDALLASHTFRVVLATLLTVGNFLNGSAVCTRLGNTGGDRAGDYWVWHGG